ncbi:hypothetical protein F2Q68_00017202 [Brassica cretica]|uniref:Uncharacterized protein n=2 Tax=Brassica cretica TaxID=69181 RepID=A0ABQ7EMY9_BRACR|nr:hypothetical protein F2Q68_00017202 [Brassica cretica]KAF3604934.1 hypothetical protein DY000_02049871 [Brassica cretica]
MTPAARHDSPKLKLQWIGRNRHWAPTPTKHSDPIPERIKGKARGSQGHGSHHRTIISPRIELHPQRGPSIKLDSIT